MVDSQAQQRQLVAPFLESTSFTLFRLDGGMPLDPVRRQIPHRFPGREGLEISVSDDAEAVSAVKKVINEMVDASNRPGWGRTLSTFMPEYGLRVKDSAGVHDLHIANTWGYELVYLNAREVGGVNFSRPPQEERWLFGDVRLPSFGLIDELLVSIEMSEVSDGPGNGQEIGKELRKGNEDQ